MLMQPPLFALSLTNVLIQRRLRNACVSAKLDDTDLSPRYPFAPDALALTRHLLQICHAVHRLELWNSVLRLFRHEPSSWASTRNARNVYEGTRGYSCDFGLRRHKSCSRDFREWIRIVRTLCGGNETFLARLL